MLSRIALPHLERSLALNPLQVYEDAFGKTIRGIDRLRSEQAGLSPQQQSP